MCESPSPTNLAVVLIAHPSLTSMSGGSGTRSSTGRNPRRIGLGMSLCRQFNHLTGRYSKLRSGKAPSNSVRFGFGFRFSFTVAARRAAKVGSDPFAKTTINGRYLRRAVVHYVAVSGASRTGF